MIELVCTLAIAITLGLIGVSGVSSLLQSSRHFTAIHSIMSTLDRARSLAVIRGDRATVCAMDSVGGCQRDWNKGTLAVFLDRNKNRYHDAGEEILYRQPLDMGSTRLSWSAALGIPVIVYQPNGSVVANGRLQLQDGSWNRTIYISKPGRARIETPH